MDTLWTQLVNFWRDSNNHADPSFLGYGASALFAVDTRDMTVENRKVIGSMPVGATALLRGFYLE